MSKRLVAFWFDFLIIFSYVLVFLGIGIGLTIIFGTLEQIYPWVASPILMDIVAFCILILPVLMFFTLQESSSWKATWGKRKAGIQVVNAVSGMLNKKQALVRPLLKLLPWQIAHTCIFHIEGWPFSPEEPSSLVITGFVGVYVLVGTYVASLLVSKTHRTPYDRIDGSFVIITKEIQTSAKR